MAINIPILKVFKSIFAENNQAKTSIPPDDRTGLVPENAPTYADGWTGKVFDPVTDDGSGGIPPNGTYFNGVLQDITTPIVRAQMGLPINTYESRIAELGYPAGAIVWYNGEQYQALSANSSIPTNATFWKKLFTITFASFLPNWNAPQQRAVNVNHTANQDGWVQWRGSSQSGHIALFINGYIVSETSDSGGHLPEAGAGLSPVKIGDVYRLELTDESYLTNFTFFPLNNNV